jgi:NitT/TauT family transport system permease protein
LGRVRRRCIWRKNQGWFKQAGLDTVQVFVSLLLLGLVVTVLFFVVDYAERLCLPWHVSQRARHERSAACA